MSRVPEKLQKKFSEIQARSYSGQAKWFLNGFWEEVKGDAEKFWGFVETFAKLDEAKKAEGVDLDEFASHRFLETVGETMTIIKLRETLRTIDLDSNKRMSLIEYLLYRYKKSCEEVCTAPQGENKEGIMRAQALVDAAQQAVTECSTKFDEAKRAEAEAVKQETDAKEKAAEATKRANEAEEAEREAQAALQELQNQENAFNSKKEELEKKSKEGSVVQKSKAANELAQLLSEDPLPLRKAKITQGAAVKKVEKAANILREAKTKAEESAAEAEKLRVAASEAAAQLEEAVRDAEAKLQSAFDFLEEEKQKGGVAQGDIWWMQRELEEKKKYMSKARAAML